MSELTKLAFKEPEIEPCPVSLAFPPSVPPHSLNAMAATSTVEITGPLPSPWLSSSLPLLWTPAELCSQPPTHPIISFQIMFQRKANDASTNYFQGLSRGYSRTAQSL